MEMNSDQAQQARFALDERIIQLLRVDKEVEAAIAYEAYLAVGGYFPFDFFKELALHRTKRGEGGLLHVS